MIKKCGSCYNNICAYDEVIILRDKVYHRRCVNLKPSEFAVFSDDGRFIGVTPRCDNKAREILREGEYEED